MRRGAMFEIGTLAFSGREVKIRPTRQSKDSETAGTRVFGGKLQSTAANLRRCSVRPRNSGRPAALGLSQGADDPTVPICFVSV